MRTRSPSKRNSRGSRTAWLRPFWKSLAMLVFGISGFAEYISAVYTKANAQGTRPYLASDSQVRQDCIFNGGEISPRQDSHFAFQRALGRGHDLVSHSFAFLTIECHK